MVLKRRLLAFVRSENDLSEIFGESASDECILAELSADPDFALTVVEAYKLKKWSKLREGSVGSTPCESLGQLERVSRKADKKMLVLCGWFKDDGGLNGHCAY